MANNENPHTMKKKTIILTVIMTAMLLLAVPVRAQIFIMDEEEGVGRRGATGGELPNIPGLNEGYDQFEDDETYAPLGGGVLILGCLGGAYLRGKRRKEEE